MPTNTWLLRAFLDGMKNESLRDHEHRQLAQSFRVSSLYERYRAAQKGTDDSKSANTVTEVWEALKDEALNDLDRVKKIFELLQVLLPFLFLPRLFIFSSLCHFFVSYMLFPICL